MNTAQALLEADHVTRRFDTVTAVDDVSLTVRSGEVVGLLGANGAGKTTLLRVLLGLLPATSGGVSMLGGPPDRERRRRLGYVPQGLGLYADLSVHDNLAFFAHVFQTAPAALPPALRDRADQLVGTLALGLQRELAFVVCLSHDVDLLMLDEPTSGVNPLTRARLWDAIRRRADGGVGVLVTTHYMSEAEQCDRLALMSQGRLVASGSADDIVGDTRAVAVDTDHWERAFAVLEAAGEPVMLAGRSIRVPDADPSRLQSVLQASGVEASVRAVAGTIEERMLVLARESARS